jgi:hypothetical protein
MWINVIVRNIEEYDSCISRIEYFGISNTLLLGNKPLPIFLCVNVNVMELNWCGYKDKDVEIFKNNGEIVVCVSDLYLYGSIGELIDVELSAIKLGLL